MPRQVLEIVLLLAVFIAIIWAAQFASKKIAGIQLGKQKGKSMQLIEAMYVSPGKMLQIIQVGERFFLIAVYKEGITFLTELNAEDATKKEDIPLPAGKSPFADYLSKLKEKAGHKDEE